MPISPIEYRPWKGDRSPQWQRLLVISKGIFRFKLRSKWIIALLIIGSILAHVFNILFLPMMPHEEFTRETMVGSEPPEEPDIVSNYNIEWGDVSVNGPLNIDGRLSLNGTMLISGEFDLTGNISGAGYITSDGTENLTGTIGGEGWLGIDGVLVLNGTLAIYGEATASASGKANCTIDGNGTIAGWMEEDIGPFIQERMGGYLKSGLFVIFTMLLAALVCGDLISEDLDSNSFVLYFSRPLKTYDYLGGKVLGAMSVLGLFCILPLLIFGIAMIGTQSGSDYWSSLKVLGSTLLAGLLTSYFFVPYGMMISSFTKRKAYAAIGIFMSFFVLLIVGNFFMFFNENWALLDPTRILYYAYDLLYGFSIPKQIDAGIHAGALVGFMIAPLAVVFLRLHLKGVGK